MAVKFAINGFGRIGRCILRAALSRREDIEFVAINDLDKPSALAHLFKYDSVHRTWPGKVSSSEKGLSIDGKEIRVIAERDPAALPWRSRSLVPAISIGGCAPGIAPSGCIEEPFAGADSDRPSGLISRLSK